MPYSFCPYCGQPYNTTSDTHFHCDNCKKHVYINSKPTASALIINHEGKVLLGKRAIPPAQGSWDIIGGFLNYGEHPEAGLLREVQEETGLTVEISTYLGTFMDTYGNDQEATLNMCYVVKLISGREIPQDDIEELQWFALDKIPENLAFANGKQMITAYKNHLYSK